MEVFSSIEETLRQVVPILLAVPGIVLGLLGLCLSLGGLRWLKPLAAFTAAGMGLTCAWLFTDRSLVPMVCFTVIPAVVALFLDKPVVVALGALLAAGVVLALPLFFEAGVRAAVNELVSPVPTAQEMTLFESVEFIENLAAWSADWGNAYWEVLPAGRKTAAAGVLLGVLVVGIIAWRWVCAVTCSTLGTGMILSGMTLLLLSKGPQALPYITERMPYLWLGAAIMVAAGTLLNRWLCPAKVKTKTKNEAHSALGDKK